MVQISTCCVRKTQGRIFNHRNGYLPLAHCEPCVWKSCSGIEGKHCWFRWNGHWFSLFFKYSAVMRQQYTAYPEITGVTAKLMRKHCSTWWLSMEKVLVKLMEQWENLFEYFVRKDPTLFGFRGSKGIFSTARYACIRGYLQSKKIPCCHHICFFVCPGFSKIHKNCRNQCTIDSPTLPKIPAFVAHHIQQIPEDRSFQEKKGDQDYAIKHKKNLKQINVKLQSNQ